MILIDYSGTLMKHVEAMDGHVAKEYFEFFRKKGYSGNLAQFEKLREKMRDKLKHFPHRPEDMSLEIAKMAGVKLERPEAKKLYKKMVGLYVKKVKPVEGAKSGLKKLSRVDELVLFTNNVPTTIIPAIEKHGMLNYFSDFICLFGTGLHKSKGHVFPELKARGAWAIIGDSPRKDGVGETFGIKFFDVRKGWDSVVKEITAIKRAGGK